MGNSFGATQGSGDRHTPNSSTSLCPIRFACPDQERLFADFLRQNERHIQGNDDQNVLAAVLFDGQLKRSVRLWIFPDNDRYPVVLDYGGSVYINSHFGLRSAQTRI